MRQLRDALVHVKNTECNVSALGLECDSPEVFVRCQWQKKKDRVSIIYLIYRFLHAFFFVGVTTWSLSDAAAPEERKYISTWAIYLTHWGITLCTVQAVVNLGLLVHQFVMEINGAEKYYTSMTVRYKVYWILHTTAVVVAIGITGSYFVAEYKPGQQTITALNLAVHAFNSILMIIDLLVVSHPFRLLHCYWPFCFVVIYFSFSAIYFLAGGTDKNNNKSIYTAVDWQKPGMTFLVILIGLLFVLFIHFLMWLLVLGRNKLGDAYANKYNAPANNQVQPA